MTDDEKIEKLYIETSRLRQHNDMLLAAVMRAIIQNIRDGNIDRAVETLQMMHDYYRSKADQ